LYEGHIRGYFTVSEDSGKVRGVFFDASQNRWRASLRGYGKCGYIGVFQTKEEAIDARLRAETAVHGKVHEKPTIVIRDDVAEIPLMGRGGAIRGWTVIDAANLDKVRGRRWCVTVSGYAVARIGGKISYMHRMILPPPEGYVVDHVDGDRLNNRASNLRACKQIDNTRNRPVLSKNNSSGYKGVSRTADGKWRARIWKNRNEIRLGNYETAEEAAAAYNKAAIDLHGEFAALNIINEAAA
jgi:hypothetical protein